MIAETRTKNEAWRANPSTSLGMVRGNGERHWTMLRTALSEQGESNGRSRTKARGFWSGILKAVLVLSAPFKGAVLAPPKYKKTKVLSITICLLALFCQLLFAAVSLYAEEITVFYTGSTHAMIYPCNCPREPDGGVSRRSTLINELRKNNPGTLLLDAGAIFAGGLLDDYTQNTVLDLKRTTVNLKAMEFMKYDAANISENEFNFGRKFLENCAVNIKIPFISSNIRSDKFLPFIIKDVGSLKIGITGISNVFSAQKAEGINLLGLEAALKDAVSELKKNNADIIILLSSAGVELDLDLIQRIEGIDVLIESANQKQLQFLKKIGSTIILGAPWQGRKLGKLKLIIKDRKIIDYSVEEIRLSDSVSNDEGMNSILPCCFSDDNCKKSGSLGVCQNPGTPDAKCVFTEAKKVELLVITPKACKACNPAPFIDYLKREFPGIVVSYLYYPGRKAEEFIKNYKILTLPAYFLARQAENEKGFDNFKKNLEDKGSHYMFKPEFTGISYYLGRDKQKGKLDLFISLYQKDSSNLLELLQEFNPQVHFFAIEIDKGFDAAKGNIEVEEYLRSVCVKKHYPEKFWDYISCRAKNINSSWWEDCLSAEDKNKIKVCAQAEEGRALLRENVGINKELHIMLGPLFLLDNQEIFGLKDLPTKEQLKKILKR